MFERMTDLARQVIFLAQEEARVLGHDHIGPEHLLLGLTMIRGRGCGGGKALRKLGITSKHVRQQLKAHAPATEPPPKGHIPFTPRAKKVLELSLREALQLGDNYIGTEHLALAILREREGLAIQVIAELRVIQVRERVIAQLRRDRERQRSRDAS
jgi:ATP-dependent Clp protease ATP-binding subunit ClpC